MSGKEFASLYLPLSADLYRIAYYILESSQDAEDEVQNLYVKLWKSLDSLDSVNNPKPYCIRLLKNQCIDRIRKRKSYASELVKDEPDACDIQDEIESRETLEKAMALIDTLPETKRKVLRMHVIDQMSYDEISKVTGMNILTIRVLVSQARARIRKGI